MGFLLKYAAPNDYQIRISLGGETEKIKVLDSEPNPSLAKWPNAQCVTFYGVCSRHGARGKRSGDAEKRRDGD